MPRVKQAVRLLTEIAEVAEAEPNRRRCYLRAVGLVQNAIGAAWAPSFLLDATGAKALLVADRAHRERLGPRYSFLPASLHVQPPWVHPTGWPVSARDYLDHPAWSKLPQDFRDWWGRSGVVMALHAEGRHLGAVLISFDGDVRLDQQDLGFLAAAGHILGLSVDRWLSERRWREIGALEERRWLAEELQVSLSQQVAAAMRGESALSSQAAAGLLAELADPGHGADRGDEQLTSRERDVLAGLVDGLSNEQIAARLHLSEATVKKHIGRVMAKWHMSNRVQVAVHTLRSGLVD